MGWQDDPIVRAANAQPAWKSAPVVNASATPDPWAQFKDAPDQWAQFKDAPPQTGASSNDGDMNAVYAALQKADAAGNTADAKQLADYIRARDAQRGATTGTRPQWMDDPVAEPVLHAPGANIIEPALHVGSQMLSLPVAAGASVYQLLTSPPGLRARNASDAAANVQQAMTYQPRTQEGQMISSGVDTLLGLPGRAVDWATGGIADNETIKNLIGAQASQYLQAGANLAGNAIPALLGGKAAGLLTRGGGAIDVGTATARARAFVADRTSLDWNSLSAGLKSQLTQVAQDAGSLGKLDPGALERQARLESLNTPATYGQITRDPVQLRNEGTAASTQAGKPIRDIHVAQNKSLIDNLAILRGEVSGTGETAATAQTPEQVGSSIQDAARAKLENQKGVVKQLYGQAKSAGELQGTVSIAPIEQLLAETPDKTHLTYAQNWLRQVTGGNTATDTGDVAAPIKTPRPAGPSSLHDSMLQYLARHDQGLSSTEAAAQGIDPADMGLHAAHVGIQRAFRKGGMSFDQAAETLHEAGYPVQDAAGNYDPNVMLDRVSAELHGQPSYSVNHAAMGRDVPGETMQALANKARAYNPDGAEAILESQADDHVVEARLRNLISAGRTQNAAAGGAPKELSLHELESLRQAAVAKAMNGGADGYYAGKLIGAIDQATAGAGGAAYQAARAARKAQALEFQDQGSVANLVDNASRTDRAVALENTWKTTVLNGSIQDLRNVKKTLMTGGTPATRTQGAKAWNDLRAQTMQYIQDQATKGVSRYEDGTPNVNAGQMDRAIKTVGPQKLEEIFGAGTVSKLHQIMEATRDVKTEPPPSFKGSSTFANAMAFLEKSLGRVPLVGHTTTGAIRGVNALYQMGKGGRDAAAAQQTPTSILAQAALRGSRNQRIGQGVLSPLAGGAIGSDAPQRDSLLLPLGAAAGARSGQ